MKPHVEISAKDWHNIGLLLGPLDTEKELVKVIVGQGCCHIVDTNGALLYTYTLNGHGQP